MLERIPSIAVANTMPKTMQCKVSMINAINIILMLTNLINVFALWYCYDSFKLILITLQSWSWWCWWGRTSQRRPTLSLRPTLVMVTSHGASVFHSSALLSSPDWRTQSPCCRCWRPRSTQPRHSFPVFISLVIVSGSCSCSTFVFIGYLIDKSLLCPCHFLQSSSFCWGFIITVHHS